MRLRLFDAFGNSIFIKRVLILVFGSIAYYRFNKINKTEVKGAEILKKLPPKNVLFVSNHQTYFADVTGMYQVFCCAKWGVYNRVNFPWALLNPKTNIYFVAAKETMKSGLLPKLFAYVGSVSIKRSWREAGKRIDRGVDPRDIAKIRKAINSGWVITFPQGTTKPFVPGRQGTAHIIKQSKPIVVPVVVDGFRRAFDKRGLFVKKKGVTLKIRFKEPLQFDENQNTRSMLKQIMESIEQSEDYNFMNLLEEKAELTN